MFRKTISIESKPAAEGQKSRTFSVELLAWVVANSMWELGSTGKERTHRPVFMAFAGTGAASRSFQANLQGGRTAVEPLQGGGLRFEIPRSAGFRYESSGQGDANLTLVYLPHVFSLQPGTTEVESIAFVAMPPTAWVDEQATAIASAMGSDARETAFAAYFVAYLDARTPLPIANDLRFHLELFRAAKQQPWCRVCEGCDTNPGALFARGISGIGFESPVLCDVAPGTFAQFLADQTARHLPREQPNEPNEVTLHGTSSIHRSRRLLPHASSSAAQLRLFGELQPAGLEEPSRSGRSVRR
jgi:hypothetical protein